MADTKITGLGALTGANTADGDQLAIVDVSDTSMDGSGTTKNITAAELSTAVHNRALPEFTTTNPSAPSSGVKLFARSRAGRRWPAFIGPNGAASQLQNAIGRKSIVMWQPAWGATSGTIFGSSNPTTTGTAASAFWGTGSYREQSKRLQINSTTTAGQSCAFRTTAEGWWRGNTAGQGGFLFIARIGFNTITATRRWIVALSDTTGSAFANADPSALTNVLGVGQDVADTQIQFMHNDGSGTCTKSSAGLGDTGTTSVYQITMYCPSNASSVFMSVEDEAAGTVAEYEATSNLPAANQYLAWQLWANNGTTAAAIQMTWHGMYIEQDS